MKMSFWDLTDSAIVKDSYYALGIVKDSSQILRIKLDTIKVSGANFPLW